MSTKSSLRITIEVDGKPRRLLSASVGKHGDVILVSKAANRHVLLDLLPSSLPFSQTNNVPIVEQHYSIHPSVQSAAGTNLIKHTLVLGNGETYSSVHSTKALKGSTNAAHLFTRCFPDLSLEKYEAPEDGKNVSLGSYIPKQFMLVVAFSVCAKDCSFASGEAQDFTVRTVDIGDYKLLVFWSFMSFPSTDNGRLLHTVTSPPETVSAELFEQSVGGDGPLSAIAKFRHQRDFLRADLIRAIRKDYAGKPIPKELEGIIFYLRTPVLQSLEWLAAISDSFVKHGLQNFEIQHPANPVRRKGDAI